MGRGQELRPVALAERLVRAPVLFDPEAARPRVAAWLATQTGPALVRLLDAYPMARALIDGIADGSPYLWDLIERAEGQLLALLQADPDEHLAALLLATTKAMAGASQDDEAMRLLRRMKAEAALLIALADIGGAWEGNTSHPRADRRRGHGRQHGCALPAGRRSARRQVLGRASGTAR